ncbi:error-prone DNA polymerase [Paracoccus denitrificans]|jgi:error-prone DNA polymerase|uniref:Error-prone DNA polymerase n=1 Tax=Paracoccus denitrificans (strain Pd 1222) TaxID=318586 RepID=A1BA11_PARDP|nr:error-prone DNA polymerase [Paracoccus denitrificans]ABL72355.1 error-prone DNA polymerase, DnaE-like protein [Paracoccus denitrificans PD1222]MBB4628486.1 error-prone DNA polymerase [Paracoccus denitrificans]MCU7430212.1 error-prone DNA polymerase [Paracoccus denitrificans]QAR28918.1 DNA polymerase III subunit alpha [Paracoccus denitrificans]UPV97071.1 error-prone DNA polymerase [Paracoccus denitrificans]
MPDHHARPEILLPPVEHPNPPADYVELAVTSAFSFLHGASHPRELALAAHLMGYDALGIADLNSLAGVVRLHATAKKLHLRPVIGARIVLADGTAFLAYPTDRAAYGRLASLITKGRRHDLAGNWQKKGRCDLNLADLATHAQGMRLIWLPGDDLSPLPDLALRLPQLSHVAASWLYRGDDRARINRLDRAAQAAGLSIVAVNDVHYHAPDRRPLQDVMTCIREGTTIARAGLLLAQNAERHLKPPAEMVRLFADWPHAIRATREIADSCRFSLDELQYEYPRESVPPGLTPQQHLENLTWQGADWRYPAGVPDKVRATLIKELALIREKKIAQYFLTIHDIVRFAEDRAILHQGRGSAANSAVCYVLGITPVDPAKHELLFERFISQNRKEPPDIDVDFEHERREEVIQHIYDRYRRDRAGLCATVIHYRPRSAIREVGKVMGLSEDVTSALADTVWGSWGKDMSAADTMQAGLDLGDPLLRRTVRLAEEMIGMPRHLSQHVGGFVLTEGPLSETVPIGNAAMPDRSFIEWDKDDIDELHILKVDVLALGMLTCIRKCFALIKAHYGKVLTLSDFDHDDQPTYKMLQRGDSIGTFQVESRAQMAMLPRLKPKRFYDLVIQVAIVRPGPIQGNMVHPYLRRRAGLETVDFPGPRDGDPDELKNILFRTEGVPIFQEQAMKIAMVAAEFTPNEVDDLRKAMATFRSRGTIGQLQDRMVGKMVERGYTRDFAERCFNQIKGFGDYGFPESHAAAFAHLAYVSAWLKCHHPAAFAAALLNSQPMGFYAPAQIVRDARDHGVTVLPADVNISEWDNTLEPCDGTFALRLGLRQIDGLPEALAERIKQARHEPYADLADLKTRAGLDARAIRLIAAADGLRSMGLDRRAGLWQARALRDAPELPLFGRRDEGPEPAVTLPAMPLYEHVTADYQTLRLSLKAHPMRFLRRSLTAQGYVPAAGLAALSNRSRLRMAGIVLVRQRPGSANGTCFVTLEDETGVANLVVWEKTFAQFRKVVMTARLLEVHGQLQRAEGVTHIVAHWLGDRSEALLRLAGEAPAALPQPRPSHPRQVRILPKSRDFH